MRIHTSSTTPRNSVHINRGSIFFRKVTLMSCSTISSSASEGCNGNAVFEDLQAFRAQVRKLRVRSFILLDVFWWNWKEER